MPSENLSEKKTFSFKEMLKNPSAFRILYIADLYFCTIAFVQIAAYALLAALFVWGVWLTVHSITLNRTFFKMRFGIWVGAFLTAVLVSIIFNFSMMTWQSVLFFLHVAMCFFVFYGMHTEPGFDFRMEIYRISKFIVYATTVMNIIGITFLMVGVKFEWYWIKFIVYENRFTGVYYNPNVLGFVSVVAFFCCHMVSKPHFMKTISQKRTEPGLSKIWLVSCIATNAFSLILCDSNAALVLALGYAIAYIVYMFFADKFELSPSRIVLKITALFFVGVFLTSSALMFRTICQEGFSVVISSSNSVVNLLLGKTEGEASGLLKENTEEVVTFTHENTNADSGRKKLWIESVNLFSLSPVIGISNGNIVYYSETNGGTLSFSYHTSDLHNGLLTILVSNGILGFALFCIFGFRLAKHSAQHLFLQKRTYRNDVYPCLFAFLFAYLMYSFFERTLLYDVSFMVVWFWLVMGYISCYITRFEPRLKRKPLFKNEALSSFTRNML